MCPYIIDLTTFYIFGQKFNRKILVNFELSVSRKQKLLAAIYLEYVWKDMKDMKEH